MIGNSYSNGLRQESDGVIKSKLTRTVVGYCFMASMMLSLTLPTNGCRRIPYAAGSPEAFLTLRLGMTTQEVASIVGHPFKVLTHVLDDTQICTWLYEPENRLAAVIPWCSFTGDPGVLVAVYVTDTLVLTNGTW